MATRATHGNRTGREVRAQQRAGALLLGVALALAGGAPAAAAGGGRRVCSATAAAQLEGCRSGVRADFSVARARCLNESDAAARDACLDEAQSERRDGKEECKEQREARGALCEALGEAPYDPSVDPADFDTDFTRPGNSRFPLAIGNRWVYEGGDETVSVEVLADTKLIEGVTCVVVRDVAEVGGVVVEDTDDWLAERLDGTIDYCGEIAQNFELFPGDDPAEPELVDVDGSWKAGRDGARPGTLFPGAPAVGQVYRQEWAPGDAEDAARVLSTTYAFGSDPALDEAVPQALAEALCAAGDCVVTAEFTPLEPDALEHKYYAPRIGLFLEVDASSGDSVRLVECNVDPACQMLPAP
jgi:hypothetical protein